MKFFLGRIVEKYLFFLVRLMRLRMRPRIIAVTGSVGKTSTKEAIALVLRKKFRVIAPAKSYNTPIGLMLGILGLHSGFSSPFAWAKILALAPARALHLRKADIWVLEMGADKPGDIQTLTSLIRPHVGVFLNVKQVHMDTEQFVSLEAVAHEKKHIVTCLRADGIALLNADDERVAHASKEVKAQQIWLSADPHNKTADFRAANIISSQEGITGNFVHGDKKTPFRIPVIGSHHAYVFLPAIACGVLHGISLDECSESLKKFQLPPGRMTLLPGLHQTLLLDSSYNASPAAMEAALVVLSEMPSKRKIAVLGSMNELGTREEKAHRDIGKRAAEVVDMLLCVGTKAKWYAVAAIDSGMETSKVFTFETPEGAGEFLQENLVSGDTVLFKGSQNKVRLERAVKMVMRHPEKARELLVRQEKEWQNIP